MAQRTAQMKKYIRVPIICELIEHAGESVLGVEIVREALRDWSLGLTLLNAGLIETLLVAKDDREKGIEIQVQSSSKPMVRAQVDFKSELIQLKVTPDDLGYLLHFFLKYYRDGVAEVDHLDIEATATGAKNQQASVVFKLRDFRPPVTPEEAMRRLSEE
jgi:hypothetical protein